MSDPAGDARRTGAVSESQERQIVHRTDLVICVIILAVAAALFIATTMFETVPQMLAQNMGPAIFPQMVLILVFVLALMIPFEHLFLERGAQALDRDRRDPIRPLTWATIGLLLLIVLLMPYLGTFLTMVAICILLPLFWGENRFRLILPFALLFPLAVTIVFSTLLKVHFDPGLLGLLSE